MEKWLVGGGFTVTKTSALCPAKTALSLEPGMMGEEGVRGVTELMTGSLILDQFGKSRNY